MSDSREPKPKQPDTVEMPDEARAVVARMLEFLRELSGDGGQPVQTSPRRR